MKWGIIMNINRTGNGLGDSGEPDMFRRILAGGKVPDGLRGNFPANPHGCAASLSDKIKTHSGYRYAFTCAKECDENDGGNSGKQCGENSGNERRKDYAGEFNKNDGVECGKDCYENGGKDCDMECDENDVVECGKEYIDKGGDSFFSGIDTSFRIAKAIKQSVSGGGAPDTCTPGSGNKTFDADSIRRDFPIFSQKVNGRPLIWLDNAATTQKPRAVIDSIKYFYENINSNIHRGAHTLARRATDAYETARGKIRAFINAEREEEIVFVRGATEAINLVAHSWGESNIYSGDEIIVSEQEHHANIVPWQILCKKKRAVLKFIPTDGRGRLRLDTFASQLTDRTKLVCVTAVSNAIGVINPVKQIAAMAKAYGAKVLIDGAQSVQHFATDVRLINCDFFAFSGHKLYAPTGIGALYVKKENFRQMQPYQSGGNMIERVDFDGATYKNPPAMFEAGTGNIAGVAGLAAAIDYINSVGIDAVALHEKKLMAYAEQKLSGISGITILAQGAEKAGALSFVHSKAVPDTIAKIADSCGIALRAGHHCAQPILRRFGMESTVRCSFAMYNTVSEIDSLAQALCDLIKTE